MIEGVLGWAGMAYGWLSIPFLIRFAGQDKPLWYLIVAMLWPLYLVFLGLRAIWRRLGRKGPNVGTAWLFVSRTNARKGFAYLVDDVSDKYVYFTSYVDGESPTDCRYTHEVWQRERDKHGAIEFMGRDAWQHWLAEWKTTLRAPGTTTITEGQHFGKPYAPIQGKGEAPQAPWVTRDEFKRDRTEIDDCLVHHESRIGGLEARLEALEARAKIESILGGGSK